MSTVPITINSFDQMIEAGAFAGLQDDYRVELIRGVLRGMSPPPRPEHDEIVDLVAAWSFDKTPRDRVRVRVQGTIGLPEVDTVPFPDVVWLTGKSYFHARPSGADVLLLIEVALSSLDFDRDEKASLYAEAGIRDYWIVNLRDQVLEVHRQPRGDAFDEKFTVDKGGGVTPLALPEVELVVGDLWRDA